MAKSDVDAYLAEVGEPHKSTLQALRALLRSYLPDAEECISYGVPTFKLANKGVAGFAAYRNHCSYFPMSGSVLPQLQIELAGYQTSKGTLRFAPSTQLPAQLVKDLVEIRLRQIAR